MAAYLAPATIGGRAYLAPAVPPTGASVAVDVYAEFPAAYAILQAAYAPVDVYAEFPASYAIRESVEVFAEFPASYILYSDIVMNYTASKARMLKVSAAGAAFAAPYPGFWNMADPKKPKGIKDPNSTIDISLDWSDYMADIGDTIASHSIVALTGGLTNLGSAIADKTTTVFISGGTVGTHPVTFRVTTASTPARVEDRTVYLVIEDR